MSYTRRIEIYEIINGEFVTPLASCPSEPAGCGMGDKVLIIDDEVWVTDYSSIKNEGHNFAKAIYSPAFVRMNKGIFKLIS